MEFKLNSQRSQTNNYIFYKKTKSIGRKERGKEMEVGKREREGIRRRKRWNEREIILAF